MLSVSRDFVVVVPCSYFCSRTYVHCFLNSIFQDKCLEYSQCFAVLVVLPSREQPEPEQEPELEPITTIATTTAAPIIVDLPPPTPDLASLCAFSVELCGMSCSPALCCFESSEELSCVADNEERCEEYSSCAALYNNQDS